MFVHDASNSHTSHHSTELLEFTPHELALIKDNLKTLTGTCSYMYAYKSNILLCGTTAVVTNLFSGAI